MEWSYLINKSISKLAGIVVSHITLKGKIVYILQNDIFIRDPLETLAWKHHCYYTISDSKLTILPIGKMPNILKQMFPSLSALHKMLNCWCEESNSSRNELSFSSINPLSPGTRPGIRGTLGAGGKKRTVRSSYVNALWLSSYIPTKEGYMS